MRHHRLLTSLIAIIAVCAGCSDDSNNKGEQLTSCISDEDCDSGKCLDSGKCASIVSEGELCDDAHLCSESLICDDGVCSEKQEEDPFACKPACKDDLVCWQKKCMAADEVYAQNGCLSDEDCANEEKNKTCIWDGYCGQYLDKGEDCTEDERAICKGNMSCIGVCIQDSVEGESCIFEEFTVCANGLTCINDVCRKYNNAVARGEKCNDEWLLCEEGASCVKGTCVIAAKEDEHCDESAQIYCLDELQCLNSVCKHVGNACTSTKDCVEKDSFCCLDDSCGAKGFCVPYDNEHTHDETCAYETKPGIFEAQVQCRWQPDENDTPRSNHVIMPPIVGHFGNAKGLDTVIAVYSYPTTVIRFVDPETCETLESLPDALATSYSNWPAAIDLDGDGLLEFLAIRSGSAPAAYKWDADEKKHKLLWAAKIGRGSVIVPFDVNGDTIPEIISGDAVLNGLTGDTIFAGSVSVSYSTPAVGYFEYSDSDESQRKLATLIVNNRVLRWKSSNDGWDQIATLPYSLMNVAYADFGTPGNSPEAFNFTELDGFPEIVAAGSGKLMMYALIPKTNGLSYDVQTIMDVKGFSEGGPITIGDFDSDGLPEVGVASSGLFGVYDPRCTGYEEGGCADKNVLWERWSQDNSSGKTGSSIFDFDGDGRAELVYADECFTRVYDGKTGKVLFSARRSSGTAIEAPVIADVDNDGSAEILMGSDSQMSCYDDSFVKVSSVNTSSLCADPIHEGIQCLEDADCPTSKNCDKTIGLCLCETDDDCNTQLAPGKDTILHQYVCAPPIHSQVGFMTNPKGGSSRSMVKRHGELPENYHNEYKVCRATRKTEDIGLQDFVVYKDRLDRWVSSRNLWNQHAYSIINVEDDGKVPTPDSWFANWIMKKMGFYIEGSSNDRPLYNNYRLNKQGSFGAGTAPDITGRFIAGDICGTTEDGRHVISGKLCNRGTKPVSKNLPATFFFYDDSKDDHRGDAICTSYTPNPVGVGECEQVGCEVTEEVLNSLAGRKVLMVSNLNERGYASTVECNSDNNTDVITVESCKTNVEIVN